MTVVSERTSWPWWGDRLAWDKTPNLIDLGELEYANGLGPG